MRGHLVKRGTSSWSIVLDLPRENGKRRQHWVSVKGTKRDAEVKLTELLTQADGGLPFDRSTLTVKNYMETWLQDVVAVRNRLSTQRLYSTIVRNWIIPHLGHMVLTKVQPGNVESMEAAILAAGRSVRTAHHVHVMLSKALADAMRKGLLVRNVCQAVMPPHPGRYEVDLPEAGVIVALLKEADKTIYGTAFRFMAYTGIRRGEAAALRWSDVDTDNGVVSISETAQRVKGIGIVFQSTKSAAGRRGIAIGEATLAMLREHRGRQILHEVEMEGAYEDHGLVFPNQYGMPIDPSVLTHNFAKLARRTGYSHLRLHDLRHAHAAGLIRVNTHPLVVAQRLGHSDPGFTMRVYGHVAEGLQRDAAREVEDMMAHNG